MSELFCRDLQITAVCFLIYILHIILTTHWHYLHWEALYYHYSFFRSCLQRHTCWDLNFLKMPVYGLWESFSRTICDDGTKTQFGFWSLRMFCVFRLSAEKTNLFMRSHQDSSQSMLLQKMSQSSSSRKWKVNLLVWKCSSLFPRSQSCW